LTTFRRSFQINRINLTMLNTLPTHTRFSVFHRFGLASAIAATSLMTAGSAFAGLAEVNALNVVLAAQNVSLATASGDQLAAAVDSVITANANFKPGVVAGEALKGSGSAAPDAGAKIAAEIIDNARVAGNKLNVAADAAKTAGSGKGPNLSQAASFERPFLLSNGDAITVANKVKSLPASVGAVMGGRALNLNTIGEKVTLADTAIKTSTLKKSTFSIAQFVGGTAADVSGTGTALFADLLSKLNVGLTVKITPGVVAGDPNNAGNIVATIVNDGSLVSVLKKASTLARDVAKVADIEEIQKVAAAIGAKIGNGQIKTSQLSAIAQGLVSGIAGKPVAVNGPNRLVNKRDEIGEVGASLMNAIASNALFDDDSSKGKKKAINLVIGMLKTMVAKSKSNTERSLQTLVAPDLAGSVALTIKYLGINGVIDSDVATAILGAIQNNAKKIAGKLGPSVSAAVGEVTAPGSGDLVKYENGQDLTTVPEDPQTGPVVDPETDSRNG
jgi:hypothetical protein